MSDTAAPKTEFRQNIVYATHDGVELKGDLYLPAGAGPFPLLINVHGGYWRRGARETYQYWGPYLAQHGYAGFTISYRLTKPGRKTYPEAVHDVRAAVQFMRGRAEELNSIPSASPCGAIPPARSSPPWWRWRATARCLTAAIRMISTPASRPASRSSSAPTASMSFSGSGVRPRSAPRATTWSSSFLGCSPMQDRRRYFEASPISHAVIGNNKTAVFLSWGTEDDLVDHRAQSLEFLLALKQAGFNARTCVMHGAPHYWLSDPIEEPGSHTGFLAPRLLRFLAERL